ncbi:Uncharacterised protein [Streptococcus pneumoniae]|nr:Uncharacterised protein [Streptococcus pneumoniae]
MPYHKDKQQAFQAAQQGVTQAENAFNNIVKNDPNYGHDLKELRQEVPENFSTRFFFIMRSTYISS